MVIGFIRATYRFIKFVVISLYYLAYAVLRPLFYGFDLKKAIEIRKEWAQFCLPRIGLDIAHLNSYPLPHPCILIGNHRSYIDPPAVLHLQDATVVAKAEVSRWPLIGDGARASGVLFVKREERDSRAATLNAMRVALDQGISVLIFPEGTTHIEPKTIDFKQGAFRLAADEGIPIVPFAVEYGRVEDAWIGDDTFLRHWWECFAQRKIGVKISYGQPIVEKNAELLMRKTKNWIDQELLALRNLWEVSQTIRP